MVLQPLLVQQITPGEPHPFVDDPPDVREAKLLRDVLVMGPDVLERILSLYLVQGNFRCLFGV